ncbi:MAG: hypothetical protein U1E65_01095 [Myxococcota bacterium]
MADANTTTPNTDVHQDTAPQRQAPAIAHVHAFEPAGRGGANADAVATATATYGVLAYEGRCSANNSIDSGALAWVTSHVGGEPRARFTDRIHVVHPSAVSVELRLSEHLVASNTLDSLTAGPTNPSGTTLFTYSSRQATGMLRALDHGPGLTDTSSAVVIRVQSGDDLDIVGAIYFELACDANRQQPPTHSEGSGSGQVVMRIEALTPGATLSSCSGAAYEPPAVDAGVLDAVPVVDAEPAIDAATADVGAALDAGLELDAGARLDAAPMGGDAAPSTGGCSCDVRSPAALSSLWAPVILLAIGCAASRRRRT